MTVLFEKIFGKFWLPWVYSEYMVMTFKFGSSLSVSLCREYCRLHCTGMDFILFFFLKRTRAESLDSYELTWTMKNICQYRSGYKHACQKMDQQQVTNIYTWYSLVRNKMLPSGILMFIVYYSINQYIRWDIRTRHLSLRQANKTFWFWSG